MSMISACARQCPRYYQTECSVGPYLAHASDLSLTEHLGAFCGPCDLEDGFVDTEARGSLFWHHQASDSAGRVPDWMRF